MRSYTIGEHTYKVINFANLLNKILLDIVEEGMYGNDRRSINNYDNENGVELVIGGESSLESRAMAAAVISEKTGEPVDPFEGYEDEEPKPVITYEFDFAASTIICERYSDENPDDLIVERYILRKDQRQTFNAKLRWELISRIF